MHLPHHVASVLFVTVVRQITYMTKATFTCIFLRNLLLIMLALGFSSHTLAQSNSAESEISIVVGESVKISNVDDWLLGVYTATDTVNFLTPLFRDDQCVFSSTGAFRITINGQHSNSSFLMESQNGDTMAYRMLINYRRNGGNRFTFVNTPATFNNIDGASTLDCSDSPNPGWNLRFYTYVLGASFNAAPPGIYQDTLTLLVAPE